MSLFNKVSGAVLVLGLVFSVANAQEKKLTRKQLPAAVEKTVASESEGATVKGFATEVEKGQRLYEAELIVNGHHKDISMNRRSVPDRKSTRLLQSPMYLVCRLLLEKKKYRHSDRAWISPPTVHRRKTPAG